jgi:hypothetical protein
MTINFSALPVLAACLVIAIAATLFEPRYIELGELTWPGVGISFLICLVLKVKYFDHARLLTCMDVFFNALIYWGILTGTAFVYRWMAKKVQRRS